MNDTPNRRILLVDDLPAIHEDFRKILLPAEAPSELDAIEAALFGGRGNAPEAPGFELDSAYQGEEALAQVRAALECSRPYALAFVDMRMPPGWDGVETIERIWGEDPDVQVVICTAYSDYSWDVLLKRLDVRDRLLILKKPFDPIEVFQLANALTVKWEHTRRATLQMAELERLVEARTAALRQANDALRASEAELRGHRDHLAELVAEQTHDLRLAVEAAETANSMKSQFLANVSHELRTPLHGILSYATLGERRSQSAEGERMADYFRRIHSSGKRLTGLIDDLLDLTKLEAGKMLIHPRPIDLLAEIEHVMHEQEGLLHARGQHVEVEVTAAETLAHIDPERIRQVIHNLIANASKFSPEHSRIMVTLTDTTLSADGGSERPALRLSVLDSGVGIPEAEMHSIFDKFIQSSLTRTGAGGTGLGLAISKEIVLLHGGRIRARNRPEGGAAFEVVLPRAEDS